MESLLTAQLENLLASKFIQRKDVKAQQYSNGAYVPVLDQNKNRMPFTRADLKAHLSRTQTFGHYLLDQENKCKFFCFDIDLEKTGQLPTFCMPGIPFDNFVDCNPRDEWRNRKNPARGYMKYCFRMLGGKLASAIYKDLELPVAVSYSGSKGIHVYGFTGSISAEAAREGALLVLESIPKISVTRGNSFFKHSEYPNLSIELFPKQGSLDGKDLGNLIRLPLGRNQRTTDPTFFCDLTAPMDQLVPIDPEYALSSGNPWKKIGE